jgi:uncharacterized OB-fold protein
VQPDAGGAPAPDIDEESGPLWTALAEHRVVVQQCRACSRRRFERMPSCAWCGSDRADELEVAGTGTVYSWVRVHRSLGPAAAGDGLPYTVATVDLDGGGRLFGRLEPAGAAAIGLAVAPRFVDHPGWTELRFTPR